jgi:hypothetical protein
VIDLPFESSDSINNRLDMYRTSGNDTLLFDNETALLGVLEDTSQYFTFVEVGIGDFLIPVIVTINKQGKLISKQALALDFGDDCGYSFEDKNVLKPDLTIALYLKERLQECNDDGPYGPTTFTETTQTGFINKKGHIIMNKPVEKKWVVQDSTAMTAQPAVPELKKSNESIMPPKP